MKKAQIQSQIFIYIFGIVVISLILIFGIKAIKDFSKDTEAVSLVSFENDLVSYADSTASEYNSVKKIEIMLPKIFNQVCFTDEFTNESQISTDYPLIKDELKDGTSNNVFVKSKNLQRSIYVARLRVSNDMDNHFLCLNNTEGRILFTLKGKGKYADIRNIS